MTSDIRSHAFQMLRYQMESISALAHHSLNDSFFRAIQTILSLKGHLIVAGVGKSGHIGKKLSATFSSTGTPSIFVHPTEAGHGDLGVITEQDLVLAISYSGETEELKYILNHTKNNNIPLISITSNPNSTLSKSSSITLQLPHVLEIDKMKLAPTTSTLITLALGDLLAVCVLQKRQFSHQHFSVVHPAGSLGKKLLTVHDIMHKNNIPLEKNNITVFDMLRNNTLHPYGCVGVIENKTNHLVGIVHGNALKNHLIDLSVLNQTIQSIMSPPSTITEDVLLHDALEKMNQKRIDTMFVLKNKKPVGIIYLPDLLKVTLP